MAQRTGIQLLDDTLELMERDFGITMDSSRVERIANEIRSGSRSASQARLDILQHVVGPQRVQQWVDQQFSSRGLATAVGGETSAQRLSRITSELMSGSRTFSNVSTELDRFAPRSTTTTGGGGTGSTPAPGGGAGPAGEATQAQRNAVAAIDQILQRYGLPKSLGKWVWDSVIVDGLSEAEVMLQLRERPEFEERFPAISEGVPISPAEYVEYEQRALELFQQSGIPGALFDDVDEFRGLIAQQLTNNVALPELAQRLNDNFVDVANAPPEVREAFETFFLDGESGDLALASLLLDPELSMPKLERMVGTAEVAGSAARFGFDISKSFAQRAAELGIVEQAPQRIGQAARLRPLTGQLAGERQSFTSTDLLEGTLLEDPTQLNRLRRRQEGRAGAFAGGQQSVSETGVSGLGPSNEQQG